MGLDPPPICLHPLQWQGSLRWPVLSSEGRASEDSIVSLCSASRPSTHVMCDLFWWEPRSGLILGESRERGAGHPGEGSSRSLIHQKLRPSFPRGGQGLSGISFSSECRLLRTEKYFAQNMETVRPFWNSLTCLLRWNSGHSWERKAM